MLELALWWFGHKTLKCSHIEADFAAHTPPLAVLGNLTLGNRDVCGDPARVSACTRVLLSNGYTAVRTIGDTSIFVCCSTPRPQ